MKYKITKICSINRKVVRSKRTIQLINRKFTNVTKFIELELNIY